MTIILVGISIQYHWISTLGRYLSAHNWCYGAVSNGLNGCYMKPRLLGRSSHRLFVSIKLLWSTPTREIGYYLWPIRNQLSLKSFATNCRAITLVNGSIQTVSPYLLLCWIGTQTQCTTTGSLVDQAAIVCVNDISTGRFWPEFPDALSHNLKWYNWQSEPVNF